MSIDSVLVGAPGRPLPAPLKLRVTDAAGNPVAGAGLRWTVAGVGARVEDASPVSGLDGLVSATWVLGVRASELQRLRVEAWTGRGAGQAGLSAVAKPVEIAAVKFASETLVVELGTTVHPDVEAVDPFGNRFSPSGLSLSSLDTAVLTVDSAGIVVPRRRGIGRVVATAGSASDTLRVHVMQRVQTIVVAPDTVRFDALGQSLPLMVRLLDANGLPVLDSLFDVEVADSAIVAIIRSDTIHLRSVAEGVTHVAVSVPNLSRIVPVVVAQVPDSLAAMVTFGQPIVTLPLGAPFPVSCRAFDRNGYPLAAPPAMSSRGAVTGGDCEHAVVARSGYDTLVVTAGTLAKRVPVVVAAAPQVPSPLGDFLQVDSLPVPEGTAPWAPSARINSRGQMEVYVMLGGDLHRLISSDGTQFHYDGLVLQRDSDPCALNGTGIENVVVVPRVDGPGWRMYYAAGSNDCYGWQVFSATSDDERTWTKEPGVRLTNGGNVPPAPPTTPPWPVGEGMWVEALPSGEQRMIVGGYEHISPSEDKWQIVEWRSSNQLDWFYVGPVLTTRDMPPEGQASVYSPAIREFAPGLWRMIFTGDNRYDADGRSRLWSAVSTDKVHWQLEGQLMGGVGTNLYYAALAGSRLVFVRWDAGQPLRLGITTVTMP